MRLQIQTALLFNIPYKEICEELGVTDKRVWHAERYRLTLQKARTHLEKLTTPQREILRE